MKWHVCLLLAASFFVGCRSHACPPFSQAARDTLRFEDLSKGFYATRHVREMAAYLRAHPILLRQYFQPQTTEVVGNDSVYASLMAPQLFDLAHNIHLDSLYQDVLVHYGDGYATLQDALARAWDGLSRYDTTFSPPRVEVIAAGLHRDIYLSDSLILIGLDYFIGPEARYPPAGIPLYLLRRYTPNHVTLQVLFYFSEKYNRTNLRSTTLLAEMVAAGKTYAFASYMQPCVSDSVVIGYTKEAWEAAEENEDIIWQYFLSNELLYQQNPVLKQRYIGERPTVMEIGEKCPGRIAQWIGWRIVSAYLKNQKDVSKENALRQLMREPDPQRILSESGYQPIL